MQTSLLPAISGRFSPRAFDPDRPVTEADLSPLLEAARWAASSNNLQPWRLAWALRGEPAFDGILGSLRPGNVAWARRAGALLVGCAILVRPDGSPNRHAVHDLGQALAQLAIQATASDLAAARSGRADPTGEPGGRGDHGRRGDGALARADRVT